MKNIIIAALALGFIAGPASAASFPEKAESRVFWKQTQDHVVERAVPLAIQGSAEIYSGGFYNHTVTVEPPAAYPSSVPSLHSPNR